MRNIINGGYKGVLRIVNPKEDEVQGVKAFHDISELPPTDLAILVIPSHMCPETVDRLAEDKGVKAFIIISAGFGEETKEGAKLEQHILDTCERHGAALIGPNCIGLLNSWHHSVFTKPIPTLHEKGVDFISGSGATAVFILESAVTKGLPFNSVWSIGNGKQIGIEDVLQYMDENFDPEKDSHVKLLYIENVSNPDKLLFHASSLIRKGCRIAAIKAGSLHVFDTSKFTVTGDNFELTNTQKCKIECDAEGHVTSAMMVDTDGDWVADSEEGIADGYYHESSYQSAPSFQIRIDGITELN